MQKYKVFIQNEAGSNRKNMFNEKTLEYKETRIVSREYPFPYGFILNTTTEDGLNVDCFVLTEKKLKTEAIETVIPIALMEQIEDGKIDHNVLAVLESDRNAVELTGDIKRKLTDFVLNVFSHVQGKTMHVGEFLPANEAHKFIDKYKDITTS